MQKINTNYHNCMFTYLFFCCKEKLTLICKIKNNNVDNFFCECKFVDLFLLFHYLSLLIFKQLLFYCSTDVYEKNKEKALSHQFFRFRFK